MKKTTALFSLALGLSIVAHAQLIDVGPDISVCAGPVTITATIDSNYLGSGTPPTQVFLTDDQFSGIINIGFPFTFYGNTYTQCVISSNNFITFDLSVANAYSAWTIVNPCPNPNPGGGAPPSPLNAIMGPWQDILPPAGGTISYQTLGTAPNRIFVVEYCNIPMFSCTGLFFSSQIIIKETSNEIETHIINKPLCTTWNAGQAIHGVHNANGTIAHIVPGRNAPTQWTAANEGYQFIPVNPTTYTINPIPFQPVLLGSPTPPIIQWYIAGNPTPIDTGISITVNPSSTTTYVAVITGNACSGLSDSDTMTLFIGSAAPVIQGNNSYCGNDSVLLTTAQPYLSYLWSTGDTTSSIYVQAGTYDVYVMGPGGCDSTSAPFTVTGNAQPVSNLGLTNPYCLGDLINLDASGTTPLGSVINFYYDLNNSGPYEVTTASTSYDATSAFPAAGNYTINMVTETSGGCFDTISTVVEVYNNPNLNVTVTDPVVCYYDAASFNALAFVFNAPGQSSAVNLYEWDYDFNGTVDASGSSMTNPSYTFPGPGTYPVVVTVTTSAGCSRSDTVNVTIADGPDGNIIAPQVCGNFPANFSFNSTGIPVTTFDWDFGNSSATNDTSNLSSPSYLYPTPGVYPVQLIVGTAEGCTDTMLALININPLPAGTIDNFAVCTNVNETFSFTQTSADSIVSYNWSFPGGVPPGSSQQSPVVNFPFSGTINASVIVTNQYGCIDTIVSPFIVRTSPIAGFAVYPICISRFTFDAQVFPDSSTAVLSWNLGDGTVISPTDTSTFNHVYFAPGDYTVSLVVVDQFGCIDSSAQNVHVDSALIFDMPNVLVQTSSIGNDKVDMEVQYPGFNLCMDYTYTIFDRWGVKMFETHNDPYSPDLSCGSCFQGEDQNGTTLTPGVYYYVMEGNFNILKTGFITIFE